MHHNVTDPSLLSTYSTERQPVGYQIIIQANDGFRDHFKIWEALDVASPDVESRKAILKALSPPMVAGSQRRRSFQQAITNSPHEPEPYKLSGSAAQDSVLYHNKSTYPGCRLP